MNIGGILEVLPQSIRKILQELNQFDKLQEIRMKVNKPLIFQIGQSEKVVDYNVTAEDLKIVVQRISNYSIYAFEEELKQGYLTIKGGHRIGICGSCVIEENKVKTIKSISSLNIRICREVIGTSNKVIPFITEGNKIKNTIIISPPKCGKTTLIRDLTRTFSDGMPARGLNGRKVCVIDERSEIGACYEGIPQMDLGIRTDILDNCPKSQGIMMAIRSMAPDLIICDEIGTYADMESILMALNSGVNLITTIHGYGIEDLYSRSVFEEILENRVFSKAVILNAVKSVGDIDYIYDFESGEKKWGKGAKV